MRVLLVPNSQLVGIILPAALPYASGTNNMLLFLPATRYYAL